MLIDTSGLTAAYKGQLAAKTNKALTSKMTGQVTPLQHALSVDQVRFSANPSSGTVTIEGNKRLLREGRAELNQNIARLRKSEYTRNEWNRLSKWVGAAIGVAIVDIGGTIASGGTTAPMAGAGAAGGAAAGAAVGKWMGERLTADSDPATLQKEINRRKYHLNNLELSIRSAEDALNLLIKYAQEAKTAKNGGFIDREKILSISVSDYQDVRNKYKEIVADLEKLPGASIPKVGLSEALHANIVDLANEKPEVRALALQRLYLLEKEGMGTLSLSRPIYQERLLRDEDETVQAAALHAMVEEPGLRMDDKPFLKAIESMLVDREFLSSLMVALNAVEKTAYKSSTINYHLEQIGNPLNNFVESAQEKARQLLVDRQKAGLYKPLNSKESAKSIIQGIVGNPDLEKRLVKTLQQYKGAVQEIGKPDAALRLAMAGEPGIGKTLLVSRLHSELNNDETGFVKINVPDLKAMEDLQDALTQASPLQAKTLFLDEFHALDNMELLEQAKTIELLKLMFSADKGDAALLKKNYGLDLKAAILALASNVEADKMKCLQEGTRGFALLDRLNSEGTRIELNDNLKAFIPEFVEGYGPYRYYEKEAPLLGTVEFSDSAKRQITADLQDELHRQTRVSGRQLSGKITGMVRGAISAHEEETGEKIPRDATGKPLQTLHFDALPDGNLALTIGTAQSTEPQG